MLFKHEFTVSDLALTPPSEHYRREYPLLFSFGAVRVELRPPSDDERAVGYDLWTTLGEAVGDFDPPEQVAPIFELLSRGELPGEATPGEYAPYLDRERGRLRRNHVPPSEIMPPAFQEFSSHVCRQLTGYASRTVRVLRWRHDVEGSHSPLSYRGFSWSMDAIEWYPMPSTMTARARSKGSLRVTNSDIEAVESAVAGSGDEPVSHQLFREAWLQRHTNLRSAIVIGVAAVEVATKEYIAALDPHAEWLVREAPTPPVERMLREYVPTLPAKNLLAGKVHFPSQLLDDLKKAVGWRNKVAHGGTLPIGFDRVEAFLEHTARDLLWLLTYYAGAGWALEHVSQRTTADFGISSRWYQVGKVKMWNDEKGWGVVTADDVPGEIWFHASMIEGRRTLRVGQSVFVEAEGPLDRGQEGYRYRGIRVTPDPS